MDTRTRLIQSTAALLWERGYVGTSPSAILRHSEVGQGSLYHHFSGKRELAVAAIEANAEQLISAAREALDAPGHAFERLERFLTRDREVLRGCRIGRLAQDPDVIADPALRRPVEAALAWVREALTDVVRQGQQRGELADTIDADATASMILATLQGGYVLARAEQDETRFHSAVRGVLDVLRSTVRRL